MSEFTFHKNSQICWSYVFLGRIQDAVNTLQRAAARKLEAPNLLLLRYYIAFLGRDLAGMQQAADQGRQNPSVEDWLTHAESSVLAYSGRLQQAKRLSQRAAGLARQSARGRGPLSTKPEQHCGKPFSGTPARPGEMRWRPAKIPTPGMWRTAPPLPWR